MGFFYYKNQFYINYEKPKDVIKDSTKTATSSTISSDIKLFLEQNAQLNFDIEQIRNPNSTTTLIGNNDRDKKIKAIRDILNGDNINVRDLDKWILELIRDKSIPRSEKIDALLGLLDEFGYDSVKGEYLLDTLGSMRPIEIADRLIDKFNADVSDGTKIRLMRILADSYGIDPEKLSPEVAKFVAQQSIGIHDFFTKQIENPSSPGLYREAIKLYTSVSSLDELNILNDSLIKHQDLLPIQEGLNIRLESSLSTQDAQQTLLPDLLNNVQKGFFGDTVKQDFNEHLYGMIRAPNADQVLSENTKTQLAEYVQHQQPQLNPNKADFNAIHNYNDWAETYANLSSHGDKVNFVYDMVVNSASPVQQATLTVYADPTVLTQLQQNTALQQNLSTALESNELSSNTRQLIQDALQRLQPSTK